MKELAYCLIGALAISAAGQKQGPKAAGAAPPQRPAASATQAMYDAAADSAERKFQHIQQNAQEPQPDQTPTQFTEREINAYLASGRVQLPKGVQRVQFSATPGVITAKSRVDFDAITAGKKSINPLMALFSGVHYVDVTAHAIGSGHIARLQIDSVAIDGVGVPRIALEYFLEHYLKPKYPQASMNPTFQMPAKIDTAIVGMHTLTVTQK